MPLTPHQLVRVDQLGRRVFKIDAGVQSTGLYPPGSFDWAPDSLCIVLCEYGHYLDAYICNTHELWEQWEQAISSYLGYPVFFEPINAAVTALYRV